MELIDTHCHIHETEYRLDALQVITAAKAAGVIKMICVGTTAVDSRIAQSFTNQHNNIWFSAGHHPHDASSFTPRDEAIFNALSSDKKLVAIGECGFDYFYLNSPKDLQEKVLRFQLDIAVKLKLPVIFHIRGSRDNPQDAFEDLWRVLSDYPKISGVVHSFSADSEILGQILAMGLHVGINGIMTFTKNQSQLSALDSIPLDKIVLETDSPFLTPPPFRGKINEPKYLVEVAEFVAKRRGVSLDILAKQTTHTVHQLFNI